MDASDRAVRACVRLVAKRIGNHLFTVYGIEENVWHLLMVDHDKREAFLIAKNGRGIELKNYGNIIVSGEGTVPEKVSKTIDELVNRIEDDFTLVRLQKDNYFIIYYVLCDPGKKQEVMNATSSEEIEQHGKILYYTKHEDPPEALSIEIVRGQFIDKGVSDLYLTYNNTDCNGWTPLHFKAFNGVLPSLSDLENNIHAQEKICGRKPVHIAVREGHVNVVEFLLNNGAKVKETDKAGWTLLHYAVWKGNVPLVKLLLQNNADIKAKDKCMGKGPMHVAAEGGHVEVIQILLDNGADVDDGDGSGRTPLYYSVWEGYLEVAKYLVSRGANVNIANKHSNKPIHLAAELDNKEIVGLLLAKGAGIEDKDKYGQTALHQSASHGILNNVRYLVENGANLAAVDNNGKTPLALGNKHVEVATYLAEKMQNMCVALYSQRQFAKALDVLKDIYDNSGLNCEHLHAMRTKCLLGLSILDAGASYDEASEVLRDAFKTGENPVSDVLAKPNENNAFKNASFLLSECIFTRSNCYMLFYCVVLAIVCRFLISFLEPGEPM